MPAQTLSIESLSPSERVHHTWKQFSANQTQFVDTTGQYAVSGIEAAHLGQAPRFGSGIVNTAAMQVPWPTGNFFRPNMTGLREPSLQPTYRGKLTGPVRSLLLILDRWQISVRDAALFLGSETTAFIDDLRVGTAGLNTRDIKDRARLLMRIYEGVHSLLRDPEAERSWISAPIEALRGGTILDIMRGGSLANLMYANSFVDYVNGR